MTLILTALLGLSACFPQSALSIIYWVIYCTLLFIGWGKICTMLRSEVIHHALTIYNLPKLAIFLGGAISITVAVLFFVNGVAFMGILSLLEVVTLVWFYWQGKKYINTLMEETDD